MAYPAGLKLYLFEDAAAGAPLATLFAQVALFSASLCLQETRLWSEFDHSGMKTAILYHFCSVLLCYTNRWNRLGFFRRRCSDNVDSQANLICTILGIFLEKFYEKSLASLCFGLSMTILFLLLVVIIQPRTDLGFLGFLNGATGSVAYNIFELKLGTWIVVVICFVLFRFKCWLDKNWLELELREHDNLSNPLPDPVRVIRSINALIVASFYLVWACTFWSANCLNYASCSAMEKLKCGVIYALWVFPALFHRVYSLFQVEFLLLWKKTSVFLVSLYSLFNSTAVLSLSSSTTGFHPHPPSLEEVVVENLGTETDQLLAPEPELESETVEKPGPVVEENETVQEAVQEAGKPKSEVKAKRKIIRSVRLKEETNVVGELPESQKKALEELKQLIQEALNKHEFTAPPKPVVEEKKEEVKEEKEAPAKPAEEETKVEIEEKGQVSEKVVEIEAPALVESKEDEKAEKATAAAAETVVMTEAVKTAAVFVDEDGAKTVEAIKETEAAVSTHAPEEVSIWGIPLLADERTDVILLKFLRARDFQVKDAFTMIKNTVRWRKDFGMDALLEEDLGNELDKVVFMHGFDRKGHPVCYNALGKFQTNKLYQSAFTDEEKRLKFLRWRILFLEKSIRKLDFSRNGINTVVQVIDLKNSAFPSKRELRQVIKEALQLVQDNYPEFVAKLVIINIPSTYVGFNKMISSFRESFNTIIRRGFRTMINPFLTSRTKSKFVFSSSGTPFKYIAPEQVPVEYGGLSKEGEQEFTSADPVKEFIIQPSTMHTVVEYPVSEKSTLVWEFRVVGWDVRYGAKFVPRDESGYTEIISKMRNLNPADERVISDSFKIGEPGKIVLTFDNITSWKKQLLYRFKTKPSPD